MWSTIRLCLLALVLGQSTQVLIAAEPFSFAAYRSLDEMQDFGRSQVKLGAARDIVRGIFVSQGGAKRYAHPDQPGVEKYVYDVNLCRLYIWRWNISANYDAQGLLTQFYVNGEPVHGRGDPLVNPASRARPGAKQAILMRTLPRPEASRGESSLAYVLYDIDTGSSSTSDEFIIGSGPTRSDPINLGRMHVYSEVELWRSIFAPEGPRAAEFTGQCP